MGYAQTIINGNLGADPDLKYTQQGKAVCSFRVAVNVSKDRTDWYRVTTWEALAERCHEYLQKGAGVLCVGRMDAPSAYLDKAGKPAAGLEMTAFTVQFLAGAKVADDFTPQPDAIGDIPF